MILCDAMERVVASLVASPFPIRCWACGKMAKSGELAVSDGVLSVHTLPRSYVPSLASRFAALPLLAAH